MSRWTGQGAASVGVFRSGGTDAFDRELDGSRSGPWDAVALGSPHFSRDKFRELAELADGRRVKPAVRFLITTNRVARATAARDGLAER